MWRVEQWVRPSPATVPVVTGLFSASGSSIVHPAETVGKDAHQVQCKSRVLLNKKDELLAPYHRNPGRDTSEGSRTAGTLIYQRHFSENSSLFQCLNRDTMNRDVDLTVQNNIHTRILLAVLKDDFPGGKGFRGLGGMEKRCWIHTQGA